jgi:hypothetical protein
MGQEISHPATFYLLGGSALCLLGSRRATLDIDYSIEGAAPEIETTLKRLASELMLDLEAVPLAEFIPLPAGALARRLFIGRFGHVDVYIFDLYSIALSKIARGFEADLEDVEYLLAQKLIDWQTLESHFQAVLPRSQSVDIDPKEFQQYFNTLKQKYHA